MNREELEFELVAQLSGRDFTHEVRALPPEAQEPDKGFVGEWLVIVRSTKSKLTCYIPVQEKSENPLSNLEPSLSKIAQMEAAS